MKSRTGSPLWIGFYLLLVFLSGALVGAFGHRLYSAKSVDASTSPAKKKNPHEAARQRYLRDMETRLQLDESQKAELVKVLDEFRGRYKTTRDKIEPEMKLIQSEQREKIRTLLNDTQKQEYNRMIEEMERKRREDGQGRSGGF